MKLKDFQAPVLFSSTFKALNLEEKISSTFKDFQGCVGTLVNTTSTTYTYESYIQVGQEMVCGFCLTTTSQW